MRSVQSALEGIAGVSDISLDASETCGKFTAPADLDATKQNCEDKKSPSITNGPMCLNKLSLKAIPQVNIP